MNQVKRESLVTKTLTTKPELLLTAGIPIQADASDAIEAGTALSVSRSGNELGAALVVDSFEAATGKVTANSAILLHDNIEGKVLVSDQTGNYYVGKKLITAGTLSVQPVFTVEKVGASIDPANGHELTVKKGDFARPRNHANDPAIGVVNNNIPADATTPKVNASYIYAGVLKSQKLIDFNPTKAGGAGLEEGFVSDELSKLKGLNLVPRKYLD